MLCILIGYGEELEVYRRCRKVWDLYLSSLDVKDVEVFFVQTKYGQSAEVERRDHDLYVKNAFDQGPQHKENEGAERADVLVKSDWTKLGNLEVVARQKKVTRWIYENYGESCSHIFFTTITSIHAVDILKELITHLPKTNVYAGMPCVFTQPFMGHSPFIFMSGANTLLSIDLAQRSCTNDEIDDMGFPNDVWLGLRMVGERKIYLPRYDIEKRPEEISPTCDLEQEIESAFNKGHFHIRVKSTENRDHTDHIILMDIYRKMHFGLRPKLSDLVQLSASAGKA